jgi:ferredoxin-thioredoxin reductase catalytic subunit
MINNSVAAADHETLSRLDYEKWHQCPSKFVKGVVVHTSTDHCPACGRQHEIRHGNHGQCVCGLHMEVRGNALKVWRTVPQLHSVTS